MPKTYEIREENESVGDNDDAFSIYAIGSDDDDNDETEDHIATVATSKMADDLVALLEGRFEFKLQHYHDQHKPLAAKLIVQRSGAVSLQVTGYGNMTMENGHGVLSYFELGDDGHPVQYVFDDYNNQEFTKKLSYAAAKEPPESKES